MIVVRRWRTPITAGHELRPTSGTPHAEHRDDAQPTDDVLRLHLVESLLTGAALAVVGRGAQFTVVGSTV
jgi:hypothetical protein